MAQIVEREEATVIGWENVNVSVNLPDLEQVVITACKGTYKYINNAWVTDPTRYKFRVTTFMYAINNKNEFALREIYGNFFTKANRVGARQSRAVLDKEALEQIPDELHNHARKHFADYLKPMFEEVLLKGVVVTQNA